MQQPPDNDRRLGLRVILKLMSAFAVLVVAGVALGYLTGGGEEAERPAARFAVDDLAPGEARSVLWAERPVIIVHRRAATRRALGGDGPAPAWFAAFANDPSRGCPVRWVAEAAEFHSSCGDARFDARGRPLAGAGEGLAVPPYRVTGGELVLGEP